MKFFFYTFLLIFLAPFATSNHQFLINFKYFKEISLQIEEGKLPYNRYKIKFIEAKDEIKKIDKNYYKLFYDELLYVRLIERYIHSTLNWCIFFDEEKKFYRYEEFFQGKKIKEMNFNSIGVLLNTIKWDPIQNEKKESKYFYNFKKKLIKKQRFIDNDFFQERKLVYLKENRYQEHVFDRLKKYWGYLETSLNEVNLLDTDLKTKNYFIYNKNRQLVKHDIHTFFKDTVMIYEKNNNTLHINRYENKDKILIERISRYVGLNKNRLKVRYYNRIMSKYDKKIFKEKSSLENVFLFHYYFWDANFSLVKEEVVNLNEAQKIVEKVTIKKTNTTIKVITKSMENGVFFKLYFDENKFISKKNIYNKEHFFLGSYHYFYDDFKRIKREDFYNSSQKLDKSTLFFYRNNLSKKEINEFEKYLNTYGREGFHFMGRAILENLFYENLYPNSEYSFPNFNEQKKELIKSLKTIFNVGFSKVIFLDGKGNIINYIRIDSGRLNEDENFLTFRYYDRSINFFYSSEISFQSYEESKKHLNSSKIGIGEGSQNKVTTAIDTKSKVNKKNFLTLADDGINKLAHKGIEFLREKLILVYSNNERYPSRANWFKYNTEDGSIVEEIKINNNRVTIKRKPRGAKKNIQEYLKVISAQ